MSESTMAHLRKLCAARHFLYSATLRIDDTRAALVLFECVRNLDREIAVNLGSELGVICHETEILMGAANGQ